MKIIKVLVDEMPSGCKRCNFCVAKMYCSLLEDRKTTVPDEPYKRRADCPLVYDFGDRETNALNKRVAELEAEVEELKPYRDGYDANEHLPDEGENVIAYLGNWRFVANYRNGKWYDSLGAQAEIRGGVDRWWRLPEVEE